MHDLMDQNAHGTHYVMHKIFNVLENAKHRTLNNNLRYNMCLFGTEI